MYNNIEELKVAVDSRRIIVDKMADPKDANERTLYSTLNFRGRPEPEDPQRGPVSFMPDGRRYKVDGHNVKWQGWEFNFGVRSALGKVLSFLYHDLIRFRIISRPQFGHTRLDLIRKIRRRLN